MNCWWYFIYWFTSDQHACYRRQPAVSLKYKQNKNMLTKKLRTKGKYVNNKRFDQILILPFDFLPLCFAIPELFFNYFLIFMINLSTMFLKLRFFSKRLILSNHVSESMLIFANIHFIWDIRNTCWYLETFSLSVVHVDFCKHSLFFW